MRLLRIIPGLFSVFWVSLIFADSDCTKNSVMTKDILQCANSSYKKIDRKLNEQYAGLVADPNFLHKKLLLEGERAWIKYRDFHCANIYDSIFPGEEAGIEKVGCLTSLASSRLVELLYLDTGATNGGFYSFLSVMSKVSSKTREEILSYIESVGADSEEAEYYKKNCELMGIVHAEEARLCRVRMKFQAL